jgi:uncharacterized protein (DUF2164 family)
MISGVEIVLEKEFKSKFVSRIHDMISADKITMYTSSFTSRKSYLNFINTYFGDYYDSTLKSLIEKIILDLEFIAPGTSDLFLDILIQFFVHKTSLNTY